MATMHFVGFVCRAVALSALRFAFMVDPEPELLHETPENFSGNSPNPRIWE
ncbi:MAG: hypothetical protein ABIR56_12700 [Polaromonas sp.]